MFRLYKSKMVLEDIKHFKNTCVSLGSMMTYLTLVLDQQPGLQHLQSSRNPHFVCLLKMYETHMDYLGT